MKWKAAVVSLNVQLSNLPAGLEDSANTTTVSSTNEVLNMNMEKEPLNLDVQY
jgi:hypothetical protein